jgi:hypothetical protein
MALFDRFRRNTIVDRATLSAFIEEEAGLLAERAVHEYASVCAGPDVLTLLADTAFRASFEQSRWEAYPLALAMVGETTDGVLRAHAGDDPAALGMGILKLILDVFDGKPPPEPVGSSAWSIARKEIAVSLGELARRPGRPIDAIVDEFASLFLALMPLHERLGSDDYPALRRVLEEALTEIRDKLLRRGALPVLAAEIAAHPR